MISKLRIRLAKVFFKASVKVMPPVEKIEEYDLLPEELQEPRDAAVEVDGPSEQWIPHQKGNVVVVEPDLMFQHRRGKL